MADKEKQGLTAEELAMEQGTILPDREEMSIINPNTPIPWDPPMTPPPLTEGPTLESVPPAT